MTMMMIRRRRSIIVAKLLMMFKLCTSLDTYRVDGAREATNQPLTLRQN
jgi:hypothetical protein